MNCPIDATTDGVAYRIKCDSDKRTYAKNLGRGGAHFPVTSVLVIYELPDNDD